MESSKKTSADVFIDHFFLLLAISLFGRCLMENEL